MRAGSPSGLSPDQQTIADAGLKALVPIVGQKTLLDFIVERLIAAELDEICLVIGPEHDLIRDHCRKMGHSIQFAIQSEAKGTADAVLASREFVGEDKFIALNSDNLYSVEDLIRLRQVGAQALIGFDRKTLIYKSNIPAERIASFADVVVDGHDLVKIVEKPEEPMEEGLVSMNLWLFGPRIFEACASIAPSVRGEYEITAAVNHAMEDMSERFMVIPSFEPVLDLSNKSDISKVSQLLMSI
jgi:glucose-1-phosphate thymidylyltransferase